MDEQTTTVTELGMVTVRSRGRRDSVYLTRNKLLLFRVECRHPNFSLWWTNPRTKGLNDGEFFGALEVYVMWKRMQVPELKPKDYHGHLKSGQRHPWGRTLPKRRKPPPPPEDGDDLFPEQ